MIGNVVLQQKSFGKPKVSTKLKTAILDGWTEERKNLVPTLNEQDELWKEFWLYASGTKSWCPRLCALASLGDKESVEVLRAPLLWNFDQGHAYHEMFQRKIFGKVKGARFLGGWERHVSLDGMADDAFVHQVRGKGAKDGVIVDRDDILIEWNATDGIAGEKGWNYKETKIRMLDGRVVVKVDGILDWEETGLEIQELKTESMDARDNLDPMVGGAPRPNHVEQVTLAMHATGIHKARITYVFKGGRSTQSAILEHEIMYNPALAESLLEKARACVKAVRVCDDMKAANPDGGVDLLSDREWLDNTFPRMTECPMKSKGKARYCAMRDVCFPNRGKKSK